MDKWNTDPFKPQEIDGKIYARGTQDMKCVCIQYILAIQELKKQKFKPYKDIILTFVPDEEIGGGEGMNLFLQKGFIDLECIEVALDEGLSNEKNAYSIFYGERTVNWFTVKSEGNIGHGS